MVVGREEVAEVARWAEGIERVHECIAAGSGGRSRGGGHWTTCEDCSVAWSARTAGNWRSRLAMLAHSYLAVIRHRAMEQEKRGPLRP